MREVLREGCPAFEELTTLFEGRMPTGKAQSLRSHVESCAVCKAEWKMLSEFTAAEPTADERADVQAVVAHLKKSRAEARPVGERMGWFNFPVMAKWAGSLAALALVVAIGLEWRSSRSGGIDGFRPSTEVRSGISLQVRTQGNLAELPQQIEWESVPGASRYEVVVTEVDGTGIWRGQSVEPRVSLPDALRAAMLPGKTLVLQVTALDVSGNRLTQSEAVRVRITPAESK